MSTYSCFGPCIICHEDYDLNDHIAVILRQCNHVYGKKCVDNLLENTKPCPLCYAAFPPGPIKYLVNLEVRREVEYVSGFDSCLTHNKPKDLYCEVDKQKICRDCLVGNGTHNGHKAQRIIEDLMPKIQAKVRVYERCKKECEQNNAELKDFLGKRRLEDREKLFAKDKIIKKVQLEVALRNKAIDCIERNELDHACKYTTETQKYLNTKMDQCKDPKRANLQKIFEEDTREFEKSFKEKICKLSPEKVEERIQRFDNSKQQVVVNQKASKTVITSPNSLPAICLKSRLTLRLNKDLLEVIAAASDLNIQIDFDKLEKEVKKIVFCFIRFDFNEEDLRLLDYILLRLQDKIHSISLQYRSQQGAQSETYFEDHLINFSRQIFSQDYKSLELSFDNVEGTDRFVRLLTEKLRLKPSSLTNLKIESISSDLKEKTLLNFCDATKSLQDLTNFSLSLKNSKSDLTTLNRSALNLPALKEFSFSFVNENGSTTLVPLEFLIKSLKNVENLEICKLEFPTSNHERLKKFFHSWKAMQNTSNIKGFPKFLTINSEDFTQNCSSLSVNYPRINTFSQKSEICERDVGYSSNYVS